MKTKVIFRTFRKPAADLHGGEVIALFPEVPADVLGNYCQSYQHTGQHGAASVNLTYWTRPSTPEEIAPLAEELRSIGYELQIIKRTPANSHRARLAALAS